MCGTHVSLGAMSHVCLTSPLHGRNGPHNLIKLLWAITTVLMAQDVFKTQAQIEAAGGKITRQAGAIPGLGTKIVRPTPSCRAVCSAADQCPCITSTCGSICCIVALQHEYHDNCDPDPDPDPDTFR